MNLTRIIAVAVAVIGCAETSNVGSSVGSEESVPASEAHAVTSWRVVQDLVQDAHQAFYVEQGIHIGPGLPGWASVSGHDRSDLWGRGEMIRNRGNGDLEPRMGSWLTARAGALRFPLARKLGKAQVSFHFYAPESKQAVSVFFNEQNLGTISLKTGWHRYTLPIGAVSEGEQRLRFWFRKNYQRGRLRTPGALGQVTLGLEGGPQPRLGWTVDDLKEGLPAPAGSEWAYYVVASDDRRIEGQLATGDGAATMEVYADTDGGSRRVLYTASVAANETHDFTAELPGISNSAYRLGFRVNSKARVRHRWRSLRLRANTLPQDQAHQRQSPVKRLVFVVLDGLSEPSLRLSRSGLFAATPTLDRMTTEGLALNRVYTGGDELSERVESVLSWMLGHTKGGPERFRRALFSQSSVVLSETSRQDLDREVVRPYAPTQTILDELHRWLELGGSSPYAITLVLKGDPELVAAPRSTLTVDGAHFSDEKTLSKKLADGRQITRLDQALAQIMGLLKYDSNLKDTLFVVTGFQRLRGRTTETVQPEHFFSPVILWTYQSGDTSTDVIRSPHISLTRLLEILSVDPNRTALTTSFEQVRSRTGQQQASSHRATQLTSISYGPWLLVLQDARRYGLYHFDDGWRDLKQGYPITQRAVRVLVQR